MYYVVSSSFFSFGFSSRFYVCWGFFCLVCCCFCFYGVGFVSVGVGLGLVCSLLRYIPVIAV